MPPTLRYEVRSEVGSGICYICLEDFNAGDRIAVTICNHAYHNYCLYRWSQSVTMDRQNDRGENEHSLRCVQCRHELDENDVEEVTIHVQEATLREQRQERRWQELKEREEHEYHQLVEDFRHDENGMEMVIGFLEPNAIGPPNYMPWQRLETTIASIYNHERMQQLQHRQGFYIGLQNPRNTFDVSPDNQVETMKILEATCLGRTYYWWYNEDNSVGKATTVWLAVWYLIGAEYI